MQRTSPFLLLLVSLAVLTGCTKEKLKSRKQLASGLSAQVSIAAASKQVATPEVKGRGVVIVQTPSKVDVNCVDCQGLNLNFKEISASQGRYTYEAEFEHEHVKNTKTCILSFKLKSENSESTKRFALYRCPTNPDNNQPSCDMQNVVEECF